MPGSSSIPRSVQKGTSEEARDPTATTTVKLQVESNLAAVLEILPAVSFQGRPLQTKSGSPRQSQPVHGQKAMRNLDF